LGGRINGGGVTDANLTGNYAMVVTGWTAPATNETPYSAVGPLTATGTGNTFSGFTDLFFFATTTTDKTVTGSYTYLAGSNGILSPVPSLAWMFPAAPPPTTSTYMRSEPTGTA